MNQDPSVIHLAVIDDHAIVRKGICAIIESFGGFIIDFEAGNGEELISQLEKVHKLPDICLLDINMPKKNGYDTIREVKSRWPDLKFLILTIFNNEFAIMRMLRNGANGYILKNCNPNDLKKALTTIHENGYYHYELLSSRFYRHMTMPEKERPKLNEKEIEFLSLCCIDGSYKEIAEKMGVSPRTVEGYRDMLFAKLDIKTRTGLATYAISTGIVGFTER